MVIIMIIIPSKKRVKTCKAWEVLGRKQREKKTVPYVAVVLAQIRV